ncbi:HAMP domain-containing histidine kinase [Jiangella ureilytica]|uniref:Signal transduction histidine-protein kinase/phosphatase MprB n=1 Tax=Jiangella ureilytica TaxID=2530374 RepID=A0A4R4RJ21_9ACTN|nr:HAMP domain-containing sensor histidine kinase [Jiangella ureilytica]TDC49558.1 HAMP domain-containing histidine kinase [Jiangella ureilytica]
MRRRLLVLVAATTTLVLVAFLLPLALLVRDVAADRAVQAATVEAQALTSLVATTDRVSLGLTVAQLDADSASDVTVFLPDGERLGADTGRSPLVELAERGTSASAEADGGREIVFAVEGPEGSVGVIRTFVPDERLARGVGRAWLLLAGLGVALLLVSLVVADRLGRRLVRGATDLAAVSHRLGRGELDARADTSAPGELGVVAAALNGLAGRITDLLREERETIADLSHRVRTPLTTLRMDAEALPGGEQSERIVADLDAVDRAVTDVIQQARRRGSAPDRAEADAADAVRERVAFWSVLAEDTERELTVDVAPGRLPVALARGDLDACVDALLGNIFAHTPHGTAFTVRLEPRPGGGARLVVADQGPGLPSGQHTGALRRGVSGSGSSGLGLDIVRRTAEQSGGEVRLESPASGGLTVVVDLGGRAAGPS